VGLIFGLNIPIAIVVRLNMFGIIDPLMGMAEVGRVDGIYEMMVTL